MRVGTRTALKRKWTPTGHRPKGAVKIGYEFSHLFVAIAPFTGQVFAMFLPSLNKACFAVFAREMNQTLSEQTLLIADRAAAHQQQLLQQTRLQLEKLPAACPELNPVERFFLELRRQLAFRVFASLEQAQQLVEEKLHYYFQNPQIVSSITLFPYISDTQ